MKMKMKMNCLVYIAGEAGFVAHLLRPEVEKGGGGRGRSSGAGVKNRYTAVTCGKILLCDLNNIAIIIVTGCHHQALFISVFRAFDNLEDIGSVRRKKTNIRRVQNHISITVLLLVRMFTLYSDV